MSACRGQRAEQAGGVAGGGAALEGQLRWHAPARGASVPLPADAAAAAAANALPPHPPAHARCSYWSFAEFQRSSERMGALEQLEESLQALLILEKQKIC